jgi:hypothetical protein
MFSGENLDEVDRNKLFDSLSISVKFSEKEEEGGNTEKEASSQTKDTGKEEEYIKFGPDANITALSIYSKELLERAAKASGNNIIYITSTARNAISQAHAMFDNLEENLDEQRRTYRAPGQAVIDVYESMKAQKASPSEIKAAMVKKINELGPSKVSNHCADFSVLNALDIPIKRLTNADLFKNIIESYLGVRLLYELGNKVFHVEIKQP